jgi:hypothetical protein
MTRILLRFLISGSLVLPANSFGQSPFGPPTIPFAQTCMAWNMAGQPVPVQHVVAPLTNVWAVANPMPVPTITYGPMYFSLPPLVQRLTARHECAHLAVPTTNEIQATCAALYEIQFNADQKHYLRVFFDQLGPVGPQYGGTGAAYWDLVRSACPDVS